MVVAWRLGYNPWSPSTWVRWDSAHYVAIAERGPELTRCIDIANRSSDDWCGSAGWLPLYPAVVALLSRIASIDLVWSAWIIASSAHLAGLTLAWRLLCRLPSFSQRALRLTLVVIAVGPAMVWSHAVFPMSLLLALVWSGALLFISTDRYWVGALVLGCLPATHSLGFAALVVVAAWLVWVQRTAFRRLAASLVALFAPTATLLCVQHVVLGHWNANFLVQSAYGHQPGLFPLIAVRRIGQLASDTVPVGTRWPAAQELVTVVLLLLAVAVAVATVVRFPVDKPDSRMAPVLRIGHSYRDRSALEPVEVLLVALGATFWIASSSLDGDVAFWRLAVGVTPTFALFRRLPSSALVCVSAVLLVVAYAISERFVLGLLY